MPNQLTVADPRAAAALAASRTRAIVFALMASEQTLQGLRDRLGLPLSLLHYHVARLSEAGLVRVARVQPRGGRARKVYAATAAAFLVPVELEAQGPRTGLRSELEAALDRVYARSLGSGTLYYLDTDGGPKMRRLQSAAGSSAGGEWWWRLELDDGAAKALSAEIRHLLEKYSNIDAKGERYLCSFALAAT